MALIPCPDCRREVSDAAPSCIHCGRPLGQAAPGVAATVTTQQTAKKYKSRMLIGGALCAIGGICIVAEKPVMAVLFFAVGLGVYFSARMGAWWNNG